MIIRFLRDNWNELGLKARASIEGIGFAILLTVGQAMVTLNESALDDPKRWGVSLGIATVVAVGRYVMTRRGA